MDPITAKLMSAAGGAAAEPVYVDDVFSCDLYTGNSTTQTITNGIDLSGEGGLVWIKERGASDSHHLFDTERGAGFAINTNTDAQQASDTQVSSQKDLYQFNSTGYSIGQNYNSYVNANDSTYVGWTFRKCPGFFDVVTYTGNGTYGHDISHNLGSVPGSIWVKRLDASSHWTVYHRGIDSSSPENYKIYLEESGGRIDNDWLTDTAPTATQFRLGSDSATNASGGSFVAYLFAHDDQSFGDDEDEAIIKCGSYTGNGGTQSIDFGFEPQFVIIKRSSGSSISQNWYLFDTMRGLFVRDARGSFYLIPNRTNAEDTAQSLSITNSGIEFKNISSDDYNGNNNTYIYIAIRRPMKTTDDADEVLDIKKITGNGTEGRHIEGSSGASVTDMFMTRRVNEAGEGCVIHSRFQANKAIQTNSTDGESSSPMGQNVPMPFDVMTGAKVGNDQTLNGSSKTYMHYFFARKPEIFDVISYVGSGSSRTIAHQLGVQPEVAIIKRRDDTGPHTFGSSVLPQGGHMFLNQSSAVANTNSTGRFVYSNWSSTVVGIGAESNVNTNNANYIGYLFASKAGVCKIGTYTGNGTSVTVDCGFQARFVLIKRIDVGVVGWWIVDSVHGINAGNDPGWNFENNNTGTAQYDLIDSDSDGFVAEGGSLGTNASGGTYFFMAFA